MNTNYGGVVKHTIISATRHIGNLGYLKKRPGAFITKQGPHDH